MESVRRILLCGNSVILGAIGASLRQYPQLEITTLESPPADSQTIEVLQPDILLFDSEATRLEELFSLLKDDRPVVLMRISPDVNLVRIWSGRQLREISTRELLEVIENEIRIQHAEVAPGSSH